jgi:hypothetical protein
MLLEVGRWNDIAQISRLGMAGGAAWLSELVIHQKNYA